jgi:hypothetical protein
VDAEDHARPASWMRVPTLASLELAAVGWRVLCRLPVAARVLADSDAVGSDEERCGPRLFSVEEVAAALGVSERWLADECRANQVTHVFIARKRRFTAAQVQQLVDRFTVTPIADRLAEAHRDRAMRRIEREAVAAGRSRR